MAKIIEAEAQTSDTDRKKQWCKLKGKSKAKGITPRSEDDAEFLESSSEGSSSSDEGDKSDEIQISNKEVIPTLLTVYGRLIFFTACRLTSIENHSCQQEMIIESEWQKETMPQKMPMPDSGRYCWWRCRCSTLNSKANCTKEGIMTQHLFWLLHADFPLQNGVKQNLIYFFYEVWNINSEWNIGQPGNKHYWCYHGTCKIFTISKAMNHSLHGKFFFIYWIIPMLTSLVRPYQTYPHSLQTDAQFVPHHETVRHSNQQWDSYSVREETIWQVASSWLPQDHWSWGSWD